MHLNTVNYNNAIAGMFADAGVPISWRVITLQKFKFIFVQIQLNEAGVSLDTFNDLPLSVPIYLFTCMLLSQYARMQHSSGGPAFCVYIYPNAP